MGGALGSVEGPSPTRKHDGGRLNENKADDELRRWSALLPRGVPLHFEYAIVPANDARSSLLVLRLTERCLQLQLGLSKVVDELLDAVLLRCNLRTRCRGDCFQRRHGIGNAGTAATGRHACWAGGLAR